MSYPSQKFLESRVDVLHSAIRDIAFGTLLTHSGEFAVSHLPFELDDQPSPNGTLLGHIARYNPQWQGIAEQGAAAMAIFLGPQAYVSPAWYPGKRDDPRQVPTWNYLAVHVHGTLRVFHDEQRLFDLLKRLVERNESSRAEPWKIIDAPADYLREQMRYIVGLELRIEKLEGRCKLSQNRDIADREGARSGLASGNERERAVAEAMAAHASERRGAHAKK